MKYIYILIVVLVSSAIGLQAQHSGTVSQYMFNGLLINPAYAGAKEALTVNMNLRQQWAGFDGAPSSEVLTVHSPLKNMKKLAYGGVLSMDQIGLRSDMKLSGIVAYRVDMAVGKLSIGMSGGVGMSSANWVNSVHNDDTDALFAYNEKSLIRPLASAGLFYSNDKMYVGYSAPSLLTSEYVRDDSLKSVKFKPAVVDMTNMEHMLTAGYVFTLNNSLKLKPSFLFKYNNSLDYQVDINCNAILEDKYWLGLSYRTNDALVAMLEYNFSYKLKVGYAYDYSLTNVSEFSYGSHEIMVEYGWGKYIRGRSPRHF